jgi:hypothetical protein
MRTLFPERGIYPVNNGLRRPLDLSLSTEDIDGAKPRRKAFVTKRCTDPLNPEYKLPSYETAPVSARPEPVGFVPTNFIADIDKSGPRRLHKALEGSRLTMDISDIPYTKPHYRRTLRPIPADGLSNTLDVKDINQGSHRVAPSRVTNPLDPEYAVSNLNGIIPCKTEKGVSPVVVGPIENSKPRVLHNVRAFNEPVILTGSRPQRYVGCIPHSSMETSTIPRPNVQPTGSRANTLHRGIKTRRCTNPLEPSYSLLNGDMDSATSLLFNQHVRWILDAFSTVTDDAWYLEATLLVLVLNRLKVPLRADLRLPKTTSVVKSFLRCNWAGRLYLQVSAITKGYHRIFDERRPRFHPHWTLGMFR